jgi:hypothetical protein
MTIAMDPAAVSTATGERYRAKDVVMAATVDVSNRMVLVTGAIDSNEHDILVRVELPSAGRWQVVKSETNLTDQAWKAWQITFGEGTTVVDDPTARNLCRQFGSLFIAEELDRLCFYHGEVRPGEAVLKLFTIEASYPRIVMAHNRALEEPDDDEIIEFPLPPGEDAPVQDRLSSRVRQGFAPRPYIEAFLPVTVVN